MTLLITVREAAETLSMSRASLYRLIAKGDIPVMRIGGMTRIESAALDNFLEGLKTADAHAIVPGVAAEPVVEGPNRENQGRRLDLPRERLGALVRRPRR